MTDLEHKLCFESDLEKAEDTLKLWAGTLAEANRDADAAAAMRLATAICRFRCGFLESDKSR